MRDRYRKDKWKGPAWNPCFGPSFTVVPSARFTCIVFGPYPTTAVLTLGSGFSTDLTSSGLALVGFCKNFSPRGQIRLTRQLGSRLPPDAGSIEKRNESQPHCFSIVSAMDHDVARARPKPVREGLSYDVGCGESVRGRIQRTCMAWHGDRASKGKRRTKARLRSPWSNYRGEDDRPPSVHPFPIASLLD